MAQFVISDYEDPRLKPFQDLRNRNWVRGSGLFIAEGPLLVKRLLDSRYPCRSVLLDEKFVSAYRDLIGPDVDTLIVPTTMVNKIIGYNFHRGVIACGIRRNLLQVNEDLTRLEPRDTLVALHGVQDPENCR